MTIQSLSIFDGQVIDGLLFCHQAYTLFEELRGQEGGPSRLRMRESDLEKKLLEEIFPICKYILAKYRAGRYISVCWRHGNQPYDAELFQAGSYIDKGYYQADMFLEVTCAMHPNDYLNRELLDTKGYAFGLEGLRRLKSKEIESAPVVHTNQDFIETFAQLLIERIKSKTLKPYQLNTTLVVQCSLNTLYTPSEWEKLEELVIASNIAHQFSEIYVYDSTCEYTFSLWPTISQTVR
jgi:hypothetical protein